MIKRKINKTGESLTQIDNTLVNKKNHCKFTGAYNGNARDGGRTNFDETPGNVFMQQMN